MILFSSSSDPDWETWVRTNFFPSPSVRPRDTESYLGSKEEVEVEKKIFLGRWRRSTPKFGLGRGLRAKKAGEDRKEYFFSFDIVYYLRRLMSSTLIRVLIFVRGNFRNQFWGNCLSALYI